MKSCKRFTPVMTKPAARIRVWATRPVDQNGQWQASLTACGFNTIAAPLLAIEPLRDAGAMQAIKNLVLDFDQFDKVIFVSQNAVREAFAWIHSYWPQLPQGIDYFAVGKKTADSVLAEGVDVVAAQGAMNSDELLAMAQMQNVWGQKILIFRGQGGLPRLGEVLHERGAIVRYCELYQRQLPAEIMERSQQLLPLSQEDVVPLFSGETLQNFVAVLDANGIAERTMPIVVPGKRVAQLAEDLGFNNVHVAANASSQEMLRAVSACAEEVMAHQGQ